MKEPTGQLSPPLICLQDQIRFFFLPFLPFLLPFVKKAAVEEGKGGRRRRRRRRQ